MKQSIFIGITLVLVISGTVGALVLIGTFSQDNKTNKLSESDHPAMQYVAGEWTPIGSLQASQGQYHYTEETDAIVRFSFVGEAVRVRYVGFTNGGIWELVVDGGGAGAD